MLKKLRKLFRKNVWKTLPEDMRFFLVLPQLIHSPILFFNTPKDIQNMLDIKSNLEKDGIDCKVYVGYPVKVEKDKGNPAGGYIVTEDKVLVLS